MEITIKPTPKQQEAWFKLLDNKTKFLLFGGGAGGGKTWLGCEWLLYMCYRYPRTKWFIGREELKKIMSTTFLSFISVCDFHKIPKNSWRYNDKYHFISFFNGSRIDLLDLKLLPTDPMFERFGGLECTGGWIEEAGEVDFKAFDVLKSRIGRKLNKVYKLKSKLLLTANPTKNWLKRVFYNPKKDGTLNNKYEFIKALYSDNYHGIEEYEENLKSINDKTTRERLLMGNWDYDDSDDALMTSQEINDLFYNPIKEEENKYITADVARYGSDSTVIITWQGLRAKKIKQYRKIGVDETARLIKEEAILESIPYSRILIDDDGVGGGVVDFLRGSVGFVNNSSPIDTNKTINFKIINGKATPISNKENYTNLKSQCSFVFAELAKTHKIKIDCDDIVVKEKIIEELGELKQKDKGTDKKLQLIPKEEVKERLGRSPDYADSLIMRAYFEIAPFASNELDLNFNKKKNMI